MKKTKKKFRRLLLMILLIIIGYLALSKTILKDKDMTKYSKNVFNNLSDTLQGKIKNKDYSKTLEEVILNNKLIEKYLDSYEKIEFIDKDNFIDNINNLLNKGYTAEEINNIYKLSDEQINNLLSKDYINIKDYFGIKNFNINNFERYEKYRKNHTDELKNIVTYVNIGADLAPYENTTFTSDPNNYLVLVNKFNGISKDYKPNDLETIKGYYQNNVYIRKEAKEALEKLQSAIKEEINTTLLPTTAYRDYTFQSTLYNNYVAKDGVKNADTYSARPGFSEHQTGLAIDLKNPKLTNIRLDEKDYAWVKENAYKYGFIVRFPKDKEHLTGYQEENWHIRYVGLEASKIIHDENLCLEEYIDLYITKY